MLFLSPLFLLSKYKQILYQPWRRTALTQIKTTALHANKSRAELPSGNPLGKVGFRRSKYPKSGVPMPNSRPRTKKDIIEYCHRISIPALKAQHLFPGIGTYRGTVEQSDGRRTPISFFVETRSNGSDGVLIIDGRVKWTLKAIPHNIRNLEGSPQDTSQWMFH